MYLNHFANKSNVQETCCSKIFIVACWQLISAPNFYCCNFNGWAVPFEFVCKSRVESGVQCVTNGAENSAVKQALRAAWKSSTLVKKVIFTIIVSKIERVFKFPASSSWMKESRFRSNSRFYFEYVIDFREPIRVRRDRARPGKFIVFAFDEVERKPNFGRPV